MKIKVGKKWLSRAKLKSITIISNKWLLAILVVTVFGIYQPSFFTQKTYAAQHIDSIDCSKAAWYSWQTCVALNGLTFFPRAAINGYTNVYNKITGKNSNSKEAPKDGSDPATSSPATSGLGSSSNQSGGTGVSTPLNTGSAAAGVNTCNRPDGPDTFGLICLHDRAKDKAVDDGEDPVFSRLATVANFLFALASVAMVFAAVWTGLLLIFSMGNEEQAKKAKSNFTYIIIGLILLLASFTIVGVVINIVSSSNLAG